MAMYMDTDMHTDVATYMYTDMDAAMSSVDAELTAEGETVYIVPIGGSNALGSMGYVACAMELAQQVLKAADVEVEKI